MNKLCDISVKTGTRDNLSTLEFAEKTVNTITQKAIFLVVKHAFICSDQGSAKELKSVYCLRMNIKRSRTTETNK